MTAYVFGTGTLIAKRTDVTNTPPFLFGVLQDVSMDFDQKLESLIGQNKVAVALGDGELKVTGKAKLARIQMTMFNNLMFNQTALTTGLEMVSTGEAHTIPATSTFTVTVTNSTLVPLEDFGVFYQSTGIQLTPVASSPATGQYTFNASTGVYNFAAGDAGLGIYVYYTYTAASGLNSIVYANPLMGTSPVFEVYFKGSTSNFGVAKDITIKLNACKSSKLNLGFANQKFMIPEFDFQAMADASGNVFTLTTTE
jgi:hypothetical protein